MVQGGLEQKVGLSSEDREALREARCALCEPVAYDVLGEARTSLAVHFRFLDQALWRMPLIASSDVLGIASNGRALVFDPVYVVERFKLSPNEVVRDVAHCLFHCIFRHPFMLYSVLRQPWDVACDIAIEVMLLDLLGEVFPSNMDRRARDALRLIRAHVDGVVTAERLYHFFSDSGNHIDLKSLAPMFFHDSHGLWYAGDQEASMHAAQGAQRAPSEDDAQEEARVAPSHSRDDFLDGVSDGPVEVPSSGEKARERADEAGGVEASPQLDDAVDSDAADAARAAAKVGDDAADGADAAGDGGAKRHGGAGARMPAGGAHGKESTLPGGSRGDVAREALAREWEQISRRMQVELDAHVSKQGEGSGALRAGLRVLNRERCDYAAFLKRFATLHERMRINDDEFDYIYYTYGLSRYGNMPLVEPLEYKEERRVSDFVLAIDTSESCAGDLVQAFARKTYNILKQQESFHSRVNVHVVQCDARVQSDTKITSLEQLDLHIRTMQLAGFGGTDFRPVFDYVNMLVEKGEFTDLRGLVYLTDGQGTFPRKPPRYDAVFAFLDDGYSNPEVPPWAFKVVCDERELRELR